MSEEAKPITFGIVTCSDTRDLSQDFAGDALEKLIAEAGWVCRTHTLVKDERPRYRPGDQSTAPTIWASTLC